MNRLARAEKSATDPNQLLSVPQICEEWETHENTVYGWIRSGQLPAGKIGPRMIRVRRSDLEEFLTPLRSRGERLGSPRKVSGLCPDCQAKAETNLEAVMRGTTPLANAPSSLAAWWLAGDNNSERNQPHRDSVNRFLEKWGGRL